MGGIDENRVVQIGPSEDDIALLQGLHNLAEMFHTDGTIEAGRWWYDFLERLHQVMRHHPRWTLIGLIEEVCKSSEFDLDIEELRREGR